MGKRNADPSKITLPEDGLVSLRQFAALVGVDYVSAREALENGRIQFDGSSKLIHFESQKLAFQYTREHRLIIDDIDPETMAKMTPLGRAKLRKEAAAAKLKEFELASLEGRYLVADEVKSAVFNYSRNIRDTVLSIPERVSAEVASRIREALRVALLKELDDDLTDKVLKRFSDAECERQVRAAWSKESRDVLSAIGKTPKHDSGK